MDFVGDFIFCLTEPNLLSGTAHSVNKRGVKRRDLDIEELREILSSLLPFVRVEHILPINSEVLSDAVSVYLHLSLSWKENALKCIGLCLVIIVNNSTNRVLWNWIHWSQETDVCFVLYYIYPPVPHTWHMAQWWMKVESTFAKR